VSLRIEVCGIVLQYAAIRCSILKCVTIYVRVLQCVVVWCRALHCVAVFFGALLCSANCAFQSAILQHKFVRLCNENQLSLSLSLAMRGSVLQCLVV